MARIAARHEIQKQLTFLTFEEFLERKRQGTDLFLKPVPPSPQPDLSATIELETKDATEAIERANIPSEPAAANPRQSGIAPSVPAIEAAVTPTVEPEVQPAVIEPLMIELVSEPPPNELGGSVPEQGTA
jgi:hypothetical protein